MADNAAAVAPVNATATGTVPAPKATPEAAPAEAKRQAPKAAPDFKSKVEETLWRVNEPTADEVEDTASMNDIITKSVENAGKPSKEATPGADRQEDRQESPEAAPKPTDGEKKKYTVNGKTYELTDEQARSFAQKGIMHELRNRETAEKARAVEQREQAALAKEQEAAAILESIRTQSLDYLIDIHGEEKARQMIEGWLRPRIERELLPPEQQQQLAEEDSRERAFREREERIAEKERHWDEQHKKAEERKIDEQARGFEQEYQNVILEALQKGGFPEGADLTPFAKDMASWMERGLTKNIEYTPDQLVKLVQEDNGTRVKALTGVYVGQIEAAKKSGDSASIVKLGEQLVGVLGEPVMYAIGKYHLAKMQGGQPLQGAMPKPILDTAKRDPKAPVKQPKLTEDEYRDMRQKIARGEMEPPAWW